jgi:hypothetical protein
VKAQRGSLRHGRSGDASVWRTARKKRGNNNDAWGDIRCPARRSKPKTFNGDREYNSDLDYNWVSMYEL